MQLGCWGSDFSKPSDTWCILETAQLYLQQMDTTSEGRTSFPTTTFSSFFFPQVWLFGVQVVMYHITQKYPEKYRQQDGWNSLHKIPQEKLILDQSQEAIQVQH